MIETDFLKQKFLTLVKEGAMGVELIKMLMSYLKCYDPIEYKNNLEKKRR